MGGTTEIAAMNAIVATLAIVPSGRKPTRVAPRDWLARAAGLLRQLGPYAALELLLPGGSLLAILLWLYRRHRRAKLAAVRAPSFQIP